ncbi:unnamed protein product [Blepharisma stoltei]|uniref:U6 snRNA-associated Sm-like protein LSm4 n=1 Tax=Blepharisma stoltei TaxID=1481888 RepID=A0AAU9IN37_9CILI|nr:unnamed protein product [Blepharisma stoltei]
MLPMPVLQCAISTPVMVELKSGECYNGYILHADYFMNLKLKDVTHTNADGDHFRKIPECYIRGNNVKYIRVLDEVLEKAVENKVSIKRGQARMRGRARFMARGRG